MGAEPSGLMILCRPEQWREAAIVLSCCPPGLFTPLLVIEPPPVDDEGYRALYEAYVAARDHRDALVGTDMARQSASAAEFGAAHAATEAAAQSLTPFRSWWRHQRSLRDLLARRAPRRALLLFDPAPGELDLIEAIPYSRIGDVRMAVLPDTTVRVRIDDELEGLSSRAWSACERVGPRPAPHGPVADSPLGWFAALACALRTGSSLEVGAPVLVDPTVTQSDEAVLVEVKPDAVALIGVQYAHARQARLVLTPAPDTGAIADALRLMSSPSDAKLIGFLRDAWRALTESPDVLGPLRAIEDAVNQSVPDDVVAAVGDRDLTAFTDGVPYGFVRRSGADWSTKAIGHVAGDPSLIVLFELLDTPRDDEIGFTLLFDTEEFATNETEDVERILKDRPAISLLLSNDAAAAINLIRLGELLPLELLYFNTHGTKSEIVLADGDLPAWKLFRQGLPSRPFVVNNSCISWTGVGREFIRTGARGYLGTLWPINAEQAATFAAMVLERTIRQGWSFARAIRQTGIDLHTDRAYIFAGTASARLAARPDNRPRRDALSQAIRQLLKALHRSVAQGSDGPPSRFIQPMQTLLWTQADRLLTVLDSSWPTPDNERMEIGSQRLAIMARQAEGNRAKPAALQEEVARASSLLASAALPEADRSRHQESIDHVEARIALMETRLQDAVDRLTGATSAAALCLLSDALRAMRRDADALVAAESALAAVPDGDREQRLYALGRVGQLARINGEKDRALGIARDGFALAIELDHLREIATFKGDETRALLTLRRADEAVKAARIYRDLARRAHDEMEDLSAAGALVQALTMALDTLEADQIAQQAFAKANALNRPRNAAQFLVDRAKIAATENRLADAAKLGLEAAHAFAACGEMDGVRRAHGLTTELLDQAHQDGLPGWQDLFRLALHAQTGLAPRVTPALRSAILRQSASQVEMLNASGSES